MKTKVTIHPDFGGTVLIFSKLSLVPIWGQFWPYF
jgi:hypothetical protein